jgi:hypothetical protein
MITVTVGKQDLPGIQMVTNRTQIVSGLTIRKLDQTFLTTSLDHFIINNILFMAVLLIKWSRLVEPLEQNIY